MAVQEHIVLHSNDKVQKWHSKIDHPLKIARLLEIIIFIDYRC